MTALSRRERVAVALWLAAAVIVWNGLYDLLLAKSTETYLFRAAVHQAGKAPPVDLTSALDYAVINAVWLSTLWASLLLLLGLITIRITVHRGPLVRLKPDTTSANPEPSTLNLNPEP
jgi:hypothetical protein